MASFTRSRRRARKTTAGCATPSRFPVLTTAPTTEEHQDVVREWNLSTFGNVPGNAANNSIYRHTGQFAGDAARRSTGSVSQCGRPGIQYACPTHRRRLRHALHHFRRRRKPVGMPGTRAERSVQRRQNLGNDLRQSAANRSRSDGARAGAHQRQQRLARLQHSGRQPLQRRRCAGNEDLVNTRRDMGSRLPQPLADHVRSRDWRHLPRRCRRKPLGGSRSSSKRG